MGLDAEMYVTPPTPLTETELRRLSYELLASIGRPAFWLRPENNRHALSTVTADWLEMPPGTFEVHLGGRYYGESYERGPWPTYGAIMRWFRLRMPTSAIWYGHDGGGASVFTPEQEDDLWRHWATSAGGTYRREMGHREGSEMPTPFCTFCGEDMIRNGSNLEDTYGGFWCHCGATATTRDGGQTWADDHKQPLVIVTRPAVAQQNAPSSPTTQRAE